MKTVIEVGANFGNDTERFLNEGKRVYAFEPTPELNLHLKNRFRGHENYFPVPLAADLENGWAWFNIAGSHDWGCSSIFHFDPEIHQKWQGRPDFKVTDRCRVQTMRLDTFMRTYGIECVDYLWIDAQGNDFRVLQSLGDKIDSVLSGQVEVAYECELYTGVDNKHDSVVKWLTDRGFNTKTVPHIHHKEADVYFSRRPIL